MTAETVALWQRAVTALGGARLLVGCDPDGAASRAYYAAFYAVSALFRFENRTFRKHSALEAAVHRDLVKSGRWGVEAGAAFADLAKTRIMGDYGALARLTPDDANRAIKHAELVLQMVRQSTPGMFPGPETLFQEQFPGEHPGDGSSHDRD